MAVLAGPSPQLKVLLEMLGAPPNCVEFKLTATVNDVVRAEVTYYPDIEVPETVTKQYMLVELAEDDDGA